MDIVGSRSVASGGSVVGSAVYFDGASTTYIDIPGAPAILNPTNFTCSLWLYPKTGGADTFQTLFGMANAGSTIVRRILYNDSVVTNSIRYTWQSASGNYRIYKAPANAVTRNSWNYIVVTHGGAGTVPMIYINGLQQALSCVQAGVDTMPTTQVMAIGKNGLNTAFPLKQGIIDEFIIDNRIWTSNEVWTAYNGGTGTYSTNGTGVALFHFDENAGTNAVPSTGVITGVLYSVTWTNGIILKP